ncbi:MAG: indole-3-glycerol-phosphate synthase TrpC [Alphaproteobacteria bacterium]|nr:indole-3-glycerol-phosphate synthase TrpC [Alphaproteobacteria bacterium]
MAARSAARTAADRAELPLDALLAAARATPTPPPLAFDGRFDLITEVKLRAPSVGVLAAPPDPVAHVVAQARAYARAGAAAISVLTEPDHFDGHLDHLAAVVAAVDVPVMRKDFLVDPYQVWQARHRGASGVLLIVRMLDDAALAALLDAAAGAGLFVLLEAFDADDLARAARVAWGGTEPLLVGVNTRDLRTLQVDGDRLARLADVLPAGRPTVAESGLRTADDAARVRRLGYTLALVGSALMASPDPEALASAMLAAGRTA